MKTIIASLFAGMLLSLFSSIAFSDDSFFKEPDQVSQDELNALSLLRADQAPIFFSVAAVQSISEEIKLIKTKYPEVAQINDFYAHPLIFSELLFAFKPEISKQIEPVVKEAANLPDQITKDFREEPVDITHYIADFPDIKALDSIVPISSVKADYMISPTQPFSFESARIKLRYLVNLKALIAAAQPYYDLSYLEENSFIGDGDHIKRAVISESKIKYTFFQGSGDCPAGCTIWNVYQFDLNPIKSEVKKTEEAFKLDNLEKGRFNIIH